ncbi:hypothetical protein VLK31_18820 [Variovorax sp. H27-G14]|uniref:hypothetical protein n=1 Tax=Variovorax sp. H27-G14 TaxID=3111914 RepID=UPI0038FC7224
MQPLRVEDQYTFNNTQQILSAALAGAGLTFTPVQLARAHRRRAAGSGAAGLVADSRELHWPAIAAKAYECRA